jgi:hypothetical protein
VDIPLKLAKHDERDLSENLRQTSAAFRTPPQTLDMKDFLNSTIQSPKSRTASTPISLDAFRDTDDDAGFADVPTIGVASTGHRKTTTFPATSNTSEARDGKHRRRLRATY